MAFPKTVVLIPSYNRETLIGSLLKSLLDSEGGVDAISAVYVADDGSADRTVSVAREAWKSAVPLKVIERQKNVGERANVNDAMRRIAAEEGAEWILMVYSDDLVKPEWLREVSARIARCAPTVGTICTSWDNLWKDRTVTGENDRITEFRLVAGNAASVRGTLLRGCWWHVSCCAIRMKAYEESGDFDLALRHNGDWEWLIKCLNMGWAVEYIPRALHYYRQHAQSVSSGSFMVNQDILDNLRVIAKYKEFLSARDLFRFHITEIKHLMIRSVKPLFRGNFPQVVTNVKTASLCCDNLVRCLRP